VFAGLGLLIGSCKPKGVERLAEKIRKIHLGRLLAHPLHDYVLRGRFKEVLARADEESGICYSTFGSLNIGSKCGSKLSAVKAVEGERGENAIGGKNETLFPKCQGGRSDLVGPHVIGGLGIEPAAAANGADNPGHKLFPVRRSVLEGPCEDGANALRLAEDLALLVGVSGPESSTGYLKL